MHEQVPFRRKKRGKPKEPNFDAKKGEIPDEKKKKKKWVPQETEDSENFEGRGEMK